MWKHLPFRRCFALSLWVISLRSCSIALCHLLQFERVCEQCTLTLTALTVRKRWTRWHAVFNCLNRKHKLQAAYISSVNCDFFISRTLADACEIVNLSKSHSITREEILNFQRDYCERVSTTCLLEGWSVLTATHAHLFITWHGVLITFLFSLSLTLRLSLSHEYARIPFYLSFHLPSSEYLTSILFRESV